MGTLAVLSDAVYRDLADEAKAVFSTNQVYDFVRGGIAEVNRVAPVDTMYELPLTVDSGTGIVTQFTYDIPIHLPYRVELRRLVDGYTYDLSDPGDGGYQGSGGYDFRATADGGTIEFPDWWLRTVNDELFSIRIHGYADRDIPIASTDQTGLGAREEFSVRAYAKAQGYDLLAHDRSLFAQWQGQTNNTDVSPTQIMQMSASATQDWDRQRGLIRTVRRYW